NGEEDFFAVPAGEKLIRLVGKFHKIVVSGNSAEERDVVDCAYCHVDSSIASQFTPRPNPNKEEELDPSYRAIEGQFLCVAGYPCEISMKSTQGASAPLMRLVGAAPHQSKYRKLGLDQRLHVLASFNIKRPMR